MHKKAHAPLKQRFNSRLFLSLILSFAVLLQIGCDVKRRNFREQILKPFLIVLRDRDWPTIVEYFDKDVILILPSGKEYAGLDAFVEETKKSPSRAFKNQQLFIRGIQMHETAALVNVEVFAEKEGPKGKDLLNIFQQITFLKKNGVWLITKYHITTFDILEQE